MRSSFSERFGATGSRTAVVVCSLGRRPGLTRLLDQLLGQKGFEQGHTVVLVDNDPTSGAVARQLGSRPDLLAHPGLVVLAEPDRGLARARNRASAALTGEVDLVAFTDDDCSVGADWLATLVAPFTGPDGDRVGCVTGLTVAEEPSTRAEELFEEFGSFSRGERRCCWTPDGSSPPAHLGDAGERPPFFPWSGVFGTGNNMAFRLDVLRHLGGFSPHLGAGSAVGGGEDLFAFLRVLEVGACVVYEPAAALRHRHRSDMAGLTSQVRSYGSGLAAMVLHHVVTRPGAAPSLLRALPAGVRHLLDPSSAKNSRRSAGFPRRLVATELLGVASAPVLYARSRWEQRTREPQRDKTNGTLRVSTDETLRVLVPTDAQAPLGGVEVSTLEVSEQLAARGHEIVLFAAAGGSLQERWDAAAARTVPTPVLTVPVRQPWRLARLPRAVWAARQVAPDVIWLNRAEQLLFGALASAVTGAPVVCHLRHAPFNGPALRVLGGRAERYLAVSAATLCDWVGAGLDPRRIDLVHNGIDVDAYPVPTAAGRAAARLALGLPADSDVVVHLGRLSHDKGTDVLRDAWPLLRSRRVTDREVLLLAVGDVSGPAEATAWLAGTPGVRRLPSCTGADLTTVLQAADVAVVPSRVAEPFGRVVVEALATGLPVVASRCGGVPEILTGEFARGLVVPGDPVDLARGLVDALSWRRADPDLPRRTRAHVARSFPLEATVDAVESALRASAGFDPVATVNSPPLLVLPGPSHPENSQNHQNAPRQPQEVDLR